MGDMWLSPTYRDTDFRYPLSLDDKITLFEDRLFGWKLNIADQITNGARQSDEERAPIQHSGFAALDIVFSYFEMIAKYQDGFTDTSKSKEYFKKGVYSVFPEIEMPSPTDMPLSPVGNVISIVDHILDIMYIGVRCGLYHNGITSGRIVLTRGIQSPMAFDIQSQLLAINPHLLVPKLKAHLQDYVARLRDINNTVLRTKFEMRYDFDTNV